MVFVTVPVFANVPRYSISVPMSGVDYVLYFDWHDREGRFFLDISRTTGEEIGRGIKVVDNWNLLRGIATRFRPPGVLCASANGGGGPPTLEDFGTRVKLLYGVL